jgi:Domain of unknown function (DUF4760)
MLIATWQATVAAIATSVAALGLVAAAIGVYQAKRQIGQAKTQIEEAKRARIAQMGADLSRRWDEDNLVEARAETKRDTEHLLERVKYLHSNTEVEYHKLLREPNFFEDLGILVDEGVVEQRFVKRSLGSTVDYRWKLWAPSVAYLRSAEASPDGNPQPTLYENFEWLAGQMRAQ